MNTLFNTEEFNFSNNNDIYYEIVNKYFNYKLTENLNKKIPIFKVKYDKLYDEVFIANLPEEEKEYYDCNTCRQFFSNYGNLVGF